MSSFAEVKSDFLRAAAQAGWQTSPEVSAAWRDSVPPHILVRWLKQLTKVVIIDPASPKRLVNHFKLGADPEFVFIDPGGERQDAMSLGFRAAVAWGADNNGRLCEIRPAPSRQALAVVTSIWATLNWMSKIQPASLNYTWRSGAWISGDGVGGHVHFGRKRSTWPREMAALDTLAFWLQHVNIFNQAEWRERIRRTRSRGNYGQLGDRRSQTHGWEYRTLPSWLDSPWLAYCILTLSKLAVYDPEFLPPLSAEADNQSVGSVRAKLRGLLNYFKGRDDDAAFAHQILSRHGWPHFDTTDFKSRWGIFGNQTIPVNHIWPTQVPVNAELVRELGRALLTASVPEWPETPPTWQPHTLPVGYAQALVETETYHHPGLGELIRDLVIISGRQRLRFSAQGDRDYIRIPRNSGLGSKWQAQMSRKFPALRIEPYTPGNSKPEDNPIYLPASYSTDSEKRSQTIAFLTDGCFPIWHINQVKLESHTKWLESQKLAPAPKPKLPASTPIFPVVPAPEKKKSVSLEQVSFQTASDVARVPVKWTGRTARLAVPTDNTLSISPSPTQPEPRLYTWQSPDESERFPEPPDPEF